MKTTFFAAGTAWVLDKMNRRKAVKSIPISFTCDGKIEFINSDGECKVIDLDYLADFLLSSAAGDIGISNFTFESDDVQATTITPGFGIAPNTDIVKIEFDLDSTVTDTYVIGDEEFADLALGTSSYTYTGLVASTAYVFGCTLTDVNGYTLRQTFNETTSA